jgi:hypothetical protein
VCREQLAGWVSPATDVRLLGLAFAEAFLGHPPLEVAGGSEPEQLVSLADRAVRLEGDPPVLRLLGRMTAPEPAARPELRAVLAELRRL